MNADELQKHMLATYTSLRYGVAAIAFAFPFILWIGGNIQGIPLADSMSAYYHEVNNGKSMRNWFVGILFAVGIVVYIYKGYSRKENYALNFAGVFAIGIAIFPMEWNCGDDCSPISVHGIAAVSFFLCIAYVCLFRAADTLRLVEDEARRKKYLTFYRLCGVGMILSPVTAVVLSFIFGQPTAFTFYIELTGIFAFSSYWLAKSREIAHTNSERRVLHEMLSI